MFKYIYYFSFLLALKINLSLTQSCTSRYSPQFQGSCVAPSSCEGAIINNLCPGSLKCCIKDTTAVTETFVSEADLITISGLNNQRIKYVSKVLKAPITNPTCYQKATFLSQLAHESGNFMYGEEVGSEDYFKKYDNRADLGNTQPGDGARFRGRGFIQITGRSNYARAGSAIGVDLVNQPERAAFPSVAAKIAVWFWKSGSITDLNTLADGTFYSYTMQTYRINGGINGLLDRTQILERAVSQLKCSALTKGKGEACAISGKSASCKPLCITGLTGKSYCGCAGTTQSGLCKGPSNLVCCLE